MSRRKSTLPKPTAAEIADMRRRLAAVERQSHIRGLIADAKQAIETIESGKSIVFAKASTAWLESIAKSIRAELDREAGEGGGK